MSKATSSHHVPSRGPSFNLPGVFPLQLLVTDDTLLDSLNCKARAPGVRRPGSDHKAHSSLFTLFSGSVVVTVLWCYQKQQPCYDLLILLAGVLLYHG